MPWLRKKLRLDEVQPVPKGCKTIHDRLLRPSSGEPESKKGLLIDARSLIAALKPIIEEKCKNASREELDIIFDNVEVALLEAQGVRRLKPAAPVLGGDQLPPPKRELFDSEIEAIKKQGELHKWATKKVKDGRSPVQWVLDYYGSWFDGLLTNHIRQADRNLYTAFMKELSRKGLPDGIDIPTKDENNQRLKAYRSYDPLRSDLEAIGREWHAARMRAYRSKPVRPNW
jgi:hypothetical protein